MSPVASGISPEAVSLQMALRRPWADHVIWTREYVVAAVAGTPDAQAAATRLLKNQEDIGNAVALVYGETAGQALTDLLKQHIMIAVDLVEAAKSGNDASCEENDRKWTENAEELAALLNGANPDNWSKADVLDLLTQHLNLTKGEVVARLQSKWEDDVEAFNQNLSPPDTFSEMVRRATERRFNSPYLKDADGAVARRFGAICTPHTFVLDAELAVVYSGRIDDSRVGDTITSQDLENALTDLVAGRPLAVKRTDPFGCGIVW